MGNRRRRSTTTTCTDSTVRDRESLFNCVYIPVRALGTVCMYLCVFVQVRVWCGPVWIRKVMCPHQEKEPFLCESQ